MPSQPTPDDVAQRVELLLQGAWQLFLRGRYESAISEASHARELAQRHLGSDCESLAASLESLALFHEGNGRYAVAKPLYRQALEVRRSLLGELHPDFAAHLEKLAAFYEWNGD